MILLLTGYRGSGKTTIGQKLADRLWRSFIDLDVRIVAKAGKSIREIFEQDGEPRFRDLETQALHEVLQIADDTIIALGGGAVVRDQNREMIKAAPSTKTIYLRCDPEVLHQRIAADAATAAARPALTALGGTIEEVEAKLAEREPIYRAAMDHEIDVTNLTPDEAVVYIVRML